MPPLHIKLGRVKQFVKALGQDSEAFQYLKNLFPKISESKGKAGIFVGPQIKQVLASDEFSNVLNIQERHAWERFKAVVNNLLRNNRAENYKDLISTMLDNFKIMSCRVSLKAQYRDHVLYCALICIKKVFLFIFTCNKCI